MDYKDRGNKDLEHQRKVIESNRIRNLRNVDNNMVLIDRDLLDKLMDFHYWKDWRDVRRIKG